jgi:hypothetical protein
VVDIVVVIVVGIMIMIGSFYGSVFLNMYWAKKFGFGI